MPTPSVPDSVASSPGGPPSAAPPGALDLEGVRRRDPEALAALFERHFDRVYGFVYRLLGDRAAAEDMTQEVFLKVHRAAHQLDPARDPGPWLATIATNACRDHWRSSAHRMARHSGSIDAEPAVALRLATVAGEPERE